jgi:hypothetical protein
MSKTKKILLIVLIALVAAALIAGLWWGWRQASAALAEVRADRVELAETQRQREMLLKERAALQAKLATLEPQAAELEAIRSALASGVVLSDISAALKTPGGVTAERLLALGASRLLIFGREDEDARRAFDQALEMMQWDSRLRAVCAAQAGLASAGRPVVPLADCKRLSAIQAVSPKAASPAAPPPPPGAPAAAQKPAEAGAAGAAGGARANEKDKAAPGAR